VIEPSVQTACPEPENRDEIQEKKNAKQKHKNTKKNIKRGQIGFNLKKLNNATV
jgi:translation elongation factor EF-1beta